MSYISKIGTIPCIATYGPRGTHFRSRNEATWAYFFDLLGWQWEYEPFDLKGYIPDFILKFKEPLLVETKGTVYMKDLFDYADKIKYSGWDKEYVIVGSTIFKNNNDIESIGILGECTYSSDNSESTHKATSLSLIHTLPDESFMFKCNVCKQYSIANTYGSWKCRVNGCHNGYSHIDPCCNDEIQKLYACAKNKSQWRPDSNQKDTHYVSPFLTYLNTIDNELVNILRSSSRKDIHRSFQYKSSIDI